MKQNVEQDSINNTSCNQVVMLVHKAFTALSLILQEKLFAHPDLSELHLNQQLLIAQLVDIIQEKVLLHQQTVNNAHMVNIVEQLA